MPFIHPLIFWLGLAGALAPLLIYLLMRKRHVIINWGAMDILLRALQKNKSKMKFEEIILLIIRTLLVLVIALLIGRFVGCDSLQALEGKSAVRVVIFALDDTASMSQRRGRKTAFDFAKQDLISRIEDLKPADQTAIVLASKTESSKPFFPLGIIEDKEALIAKIKNLKCSDLSTDFAKLFKKIDKLIPAEQIQKDELQCQFYLLSDFRAAEYANQKKFASMVKKIHKLRETKTLVKFLNYGSDSKNNLVIETVKTADAYCVKNIPTEIIVQVKNSGTAAVSGAEISLARVTVDTEKNRDEEISSLLAKLKIKTLLPGQTWTGKVPYLPDTPGHEVIRATLSQDDLAVDNTHNTTIAIKPYLKVLLVDGQTRPDSISPAYRSLQTVLDPDETHKNNFAVDVITRDNISRTNFEDYDIVALLGVKDFPRAALTGEKKSSNSNEKYPAVARLERFVKLGGGLVIFTGNDLNLAFYNDRLFKKGLGLSPYKITRPVGDPNNRAKYFSIVPTSMQATGLFNFFVVNKVEPLVRAISIFAFSQALVPQKEIANKEILAPAILARLNDKSKSPFIVSRKFGQGKVAMIYTTASKQWNDWSLDDTPYGRGIYVSPIRDIFEKIGKPQSTVYTNTVGSGIDFSVPVSWQNASLKLIPPGVSARIPKVAITGVNTGRPGVVYRNDNRAGLYKFKMQKPGNREPRFVLVSRNIATIESELKTLTQAELVSKLQLGSEDKFSYMDRSEVNPVRIDRKGDDQKYWPWLVGLVFLLFFAETHLARKFAHWQN